MYLKPVKLFLKNLVKKLLFVNLDHYLAKLAVLSLPLLLTLTVIRLNYLVERIILKNLRLKRRMNKFTFFEKIKLTLFLDFLDPDCSSLSVIWDHNGITHVVLRFLVLSSKEVYICIMDRLFHLFWCLNFCAKTKTN
jgi:hypothetical protein